MAKASKMYPKFLAQAEAHVDEPVLAVGFLPTAGTMRSAVQSTLAYKFAYQVSPVGAAMDRKLGVRITGEPLVWPRTDFTATADKPGRMTQTVHVRFADGSTLDLEALQSAGYGALNQPMIELLQQPPSQPPVA